MDKALKDKPVEDFSIPSDIVIAEIDSETGLLPLIEVYTEVGLMTVKGSGEIITEFFKKGTTPTKYTPTRAERPRGTEIKKIEKGPLPWI